MLGIVVRVVMAVCGASAAWKSVRTVWLHSSAAGWRVESPALMRFRVLRVCVTVFYHTAIVAFLLADMLGEFHISLLFAHASFSTEWPISSYNPIALGIVYPSRTLCFPVARRSPRFQIDLRELMQALKQERTATDVLGKRGPWQKRRRPAGDKDGDEEGGAGGQETFVAPSSEKGNSPEAEGETIGGPQAGLGAEPDGEVEGDEAAAREGRPLFSLEEAESLTSFLVESQQAFSLINVADIQHGEAPWSVSTVLSRSRTPGYDSHWVSYSQDSVL